jgi:hypothetical protein
MEIEDGRIKLEVPTEEINIYFSSNVLCDKAKIIKAKVDSLNRLYVWIKKD